MIKSIIHATLILGCLVGAFGPAAQPQSAPPPPPTNVAQGRTPQTVAVPLDRYTHAVVVRGDLLTVSVNGARGRSKGKAAITIEISDGGWKQAGSIGKEPSSGTLARGEIVKIDKVESSAKRLDMRLVSIDPHEIVVDPKKPDRNRHEPVATVLHVEQPRDPGLRPLLDAYVRLFQTLEAAQAYARDLATPQPDRRFSIGVVRRDGLLVPIASYDDGHWFSRWPTPVENREVPIALDQVPPDWWGLEGAASWTMWLPGGASHALKVQAPLAFDAHCMMNVGLRTDYVSPLPMPPLEQHHYPKDGLAMTGSAKIEPLQIATASDARWAPFEKSLAADVVRAELTDIRFVDRWDARRFRPISEFPNTPLKLEVMCVGPGMTPGTAATYFEATKRYPAPPLARFADKPCEPVTFAGGFAFEKNIHQFREFRLTDCTEWDVEFRRPLGALRVGGKAIWIMEIERWGGESYEIVEMTSAGVNILLTVQGGWCKTLGN